MILLYFFMDVCFYNYTSWKTTLFLVSLTEKDEKFLSFLFYLTGITLLLHASFKFFLLGLILYIFTKKINITTPNFKRCFLCFFILYILYQFLAYLFFQKVIFSISGFLINIAFLFFSYKFFRKSYSFIGDYNGQCHNRSAKSDKKQKTTFSK